MFTVGFKALGLRFRVYGLGFEGNVGSPIDFAGTGRKRPRGICTLLYMTVEERSNEEPNSCRTFGIL